MVALAPAWLFSSCLQSHLITCAHSTGSCGQQPWAGRPCTLQHSISAACCGQPQGTQGLWAWCTTQTPRTGTHPPFFQAEPRLLLFLIPAAHDTGGQSPPAQRVMGSAALCSNTSHTAQILCSVCSSNSSSLRRALASPPQPLPSSEWQPREKREAFEGWSGPKHLLSTHTETTGHAAWALRGLHEPGLSFHYVTGA